MKLINSDNNNEIDAVDFMNQEYESSENKNEIDYWSAYSKVILESLHLRSKFNLSQSQLADLLRTTQSVISRFETKLPLAASVYQLPYMAYPEHPAVNGIQGSTDHARAIILSSHLRWSFGGMRWSVLLGPRRRRSGRPEK